MPFVEVGQQGASPGNKASSVLLPLSWRRTPWAQMGTITDEFEKWECVYYQEALGPKLFLVFLVLENGDHNLKAQL